MYSHLFQGLSKMDVGGFTEMNDWTIVTGFSVLPGKSEKHSITSEKLALTLYDMVYYRIQRS